MFLRYVRVGSHEVLRSINAPIRNQNWATIAPEVSNLQVELRGDSFKVTFDVACQQADIDFRWKGSISGSDKGVIEFTFDGEAHSTFKLTGLLFHHLIYHRLNWLKRVMPLVSMIGILIMTVLTVAVGRDKLMQVGPLLIVACVIHSTAGFGLGYFVCRLLGRDKLTCRTIALEAGLQNSGMAAGLAKDLGKVATLGLVPILFGPVMNIIASTLANNARSCEDYPQYQRNSSLSRP